MNCHRLSSKLVKIETCAETVHLSRCTSEACTSPGKKHGFWDPDGDPFARPLRSWGPAAVTVRSKFATCKAETDEKLAEVQAAVLETEILGFCM